MCAAIVAVPTTGRKVNHNGGHLPINMRRKLLSTTLDQETDMRFGEKIAGAFTVLKDAPLSPTPMVIRESTSSLTKLQDARSKGKFRADKLKPTTSSKKKRKRKVTVKVKKDEAFVEPVQEQPKPVPTKPAAPKKKAVKKAKPKQKVKQTKQQEKQQGATSFVASESIAKDFIRRVESGDMTAARQFLRDCFGVDSTANTTLDAMHAEANMYVFVQEHIEMLEAACLLAEPQLPPKGAAKVATDDGPDITYQVSVSKPNPLYGEWRQKKLIKAKGTVTRPSRYVKWMSDNHNPKSKSGKPLMADLTAPVHGDVFTISMSVKDDVPIMVGNLQLGYKAVTSVAKIPVDERMFREYGCIIFNWGPLHMEGVRKSYQSAASRQKDDVTFYAPDSMSPPWKEEQVTDNEPFLTAEIYHERQLAMIKRSNDEVRADKARATELNQKWWEMGQLSRLIPRHVLASTPEPAPDKQDETVIVTTDSVKLAKELNEFGKFNPSTVKVMVRALRPKSGAQIVYEVELEKRAEERAEYQQWYMARPDLMRQWEREKKYLERFDSTERNRLDRVMANMITPAGHDEARYEEYWDKLAADPQTPQNSLFNLDQHVFFNPVSPHVKLKCVERRELIKQRVEDLYLIGKTAPKHQVEEAASKEPDKKEPVLLPDIDPEQYAFDEIMRDRKTTVAKSLSDMLKGKVIDMSTFKYFKSFAKNDSGLYVPPDLA